MSKPNFIAWQRSHDEGYCESHCGCYEITPRWWGRVKAQSYVLCYRGKRLCEEDTQRKCKEQADRHYCQLNTKIITVQL